MTRKALPKVIRRKLDDLQAIGASPITDEPRKKPELVSAATHPPSMEAPAQHAISLRNRPEAAALPPAVSSPPIEGEVLPPVAVADDQRAVRRQAVGRKIVDRYKRYAALGGLFPLPVVNVASLAAINLRMVKVLSNLYGAPFERDRVRAIIIGVLGGAAPSGLALATASTLALVTPGAGFVGLAVSSFSAAAFTRGIGSAFIDRFEQEIQDKS